MKKTFRLQCSDILFIISVALFITVIQNTRFFAHAWNIVNINSFHSFMFSASMPVLLFCCLNIIFTLLLLPYIRKPVAIVLILTGAAINYFMYSFNTVIDQNMTQNALETNAHEALDLLSFKMVIWFTLLGIIPSIAVALTKIKTTKSIWHFVWLKGVNIIVSTLIIILIALFFYKDYAPFFRNNKESVKMLTPSNMVGSLINNVANYLDARKPFVQIGLDAHKGPLLAQQPKKTLVILVLGETARAESFSLGGYDKNTNPMLSKRNDIIYFDNVSSCGTETAVSVPCMFSNMTRKEYSASQAKHTENLLDILARAKINVLWRDNDGGCKGVCNRVPSEDMTAFKLPQYCQDGACLDEILLHKLDDYINQLDNDGIIVLHQMGSHGPSYHQRYSKEYRHFMPTCDTNDIQDCDTTSLRNTYDNTLLYTDAVLDKTISLLQKHHDRFNTAMLYLSDHGESLGENGLYLHGAPYALAPSQQTHVPMLLWTSSDYRRSQKLDENCLAKEAKQNQFSQDNLFHSLLGTFNIQTGEYQAPLDMFKSCRQNS
ncbi:Phosphoethanolamine transferase eptA [Pragia fontium]|uniref:phosphoethanolamine transferase EptA n=1 Tax=Pragia fontium TaxID=82985 RepID=UPI000DFD910E|nr:phosphoethanolamine transferase EptA [Pragia fontium]SUB82646.1 Phosphoethanolamine transferase eptA [Pragia fontium]